MDIKTQESLIVLLYQLAQVDNEFHENEKVFIQNVMLKFPQHNPENFSEELHIPQAEEDRMTMLYYLFFMIKSDFEITPKEEEFVSKVAVKLGFRQEMINKMLIVFKKHINKIIPPEELINIIKSYHN